MRRYRNCKIVATLGPATSDRQTIEDLFKAGADVFRLNFSHGSHADQKARYDIVRQLEKDYNRPIAILADLQGPKLRVGQFEEGKVTLEAGQEFQLDMDKTPGTQHRAPLPHPEIFSAVKAGTQLLLDDGKLVLEITDVAPDSLKTRVVIGGVLSNNKGVNVPNSVLDISPLSERDRQDLAFALDLGADWIALSFVQRPEDVREARELVGKRAAILSKIEKPAAVDHLDEIVALSDGLMVARGDLGVEMPPEQVPSIQKRIVRKARQAGKPVIVATQMLDSMVDSPSPTRPEASDVATAVYDGSDAVMLSAETAAGSYPVQTVQMMNRIINSVERDPLHRKMMEDSGPEADATIADAITRAATRSALLIKAAAIVTFTVSGATGHRTSRERPSVPILTLTPELQTARRTVLAWGIHPVHLPHFNDFDHMVEKAAQVTLEEEFAQNGDHIIITAGVPFGNPGSTNIMRITTVT